MSARDSAGPAGPGNGGAGGLGNGGIGGGFGGGAAGGQGGMGAGAGRNGGYGSQTGMTTGDTWAGNTAFGRPGQMAMGYAMRDPRSLAAAGMGPMAGQFGQFNTIQGNPMFAGSPVQGQTFTGMNAMQALSQAQRAQAAWQAAQQYVGGILGAAHPAVDQEMSLPTYEPTVEPVSAPPSMPNVFNQDWLNKIANFRATMLSRDQAPAAPAPDPLANDLTQFANPNGRRINAVGMQGGLGAQSYSTSRDPHYGWR